MNHTFPVLLIAVVCIGISAIPARAAGSGSNSAIVHLAKPQKPAVSSVIPNVGPATGGQLITVTGTGFLVGATVEIGQGHGSGPTAILANAVTVVSSTEITATTGGPAKAGTWNLFVITPDGTSSSRAADDYTYSSPPRPSVLSVKPNVGPANGGQLITVTGTGFAVGAIVEIGQGHGSGATAIVANAVTVVSSTEITASTGGTAKAGTWNLFVITPGGTSWPRADDMYTYTRS